MAQDMPERNGVFELPPPTMESAEPQAAERAMSLPTPMLVENVFWFCQLRWIVVASLAAFGGLGFFPSIIEPMGLRSGLRWPFVVAAILAACNLGFLAHARHLRRNVTARAAAVNLWSQIVLDLIVLSAVVHFAGSVLTYAAFAYLFHIVLACIFFSRTQGLAVTVLASALYVGCVALEVGGILPPASIYAGQTDAPVAEQASGESVIAVVSAIGIWGVVWYLAGRLAGMVRERDHNLALTNRRLIAAQQERARHILYTTHELKAPFAAIQANAQLMTNGYCGELPEKALDVSHRIVRRCQRLTGMIQEMLQLANLRSSADEAPLPATVDLRPLIEECIERVKPAAAERNITIESNLQTASVTGIEEHLRMMLLNVVSNGVLYSNEDGEVRVQCSAGEDGQACVTVEDSGIGIAAEKLPRIFDEYYRTNEAAVHNCRSTGLGLAIVRHVAAEHEVAIRVESEPGNGTLFALSFPALEDTIV